MPTENKAITEWSDYYLTDGGFELRQKAIGESYIVKFTRAEVGEGRPSDPQDIWAMTELVESKFGAEVKGSAAAGTNHKITIQINNEALRDEVYMREIGVFAQLLDTEGKEVIPELLYGYSYTVKGYESIPPGASQNRIWDIGADTHISRSSNVTIIYDGSFLSVTHDELALTLENYYTRPQVDELISDFAVTELPWGSITGKPSTYPPESHKHTKSQITDFPTSITPTAHNHAAGDITSGTLAAGRGGTGQTSLQATRNAMGLGNTTGALPIGNGGTGAATAAAALTALSAYSKAEVNSLLANKVNTGTPALVNLSLASGLKVCNSATYYKNQLNEVVVGLSVEASSTISKDTVLATLPSGYRPASTIERSCAVYDQKEYHTGTILISSNGQITAKFTASNVVFVHSSVIVFPATG